MTIEQGKKAPSFSLNDQDGDKIKLNDLAGQWVVLYFYPRDDTPGCTIEARDFTANFRAFQKLGAIVYGCSPDSVESHQKFIRKYKLKIGLLSDPNHKTMQKYGAWGEKNMYGKITVGVIRSTVLIDPNGKVARHWKRVKTKGHADSVQKTLEELNTL
ncbi:MAG TPA: peroxiredoxin [Arenicellales bacterium]|jgi:peroxiredoxin Q/BCP|nr:peroxiredoxin [Acidiferrobacteraceae bacterium]MDP6137390.1 peroxiredoxin [Arenicellales bacterium]MDP7218762.1 peroxiredoxin [Arenicellales bacterium]HCF73277.1 peroxiredoxin [Gammaproteobacteria bacterium]HJP11986.1 peroxiredoxin [Arenicellales bacterium]|tara:strand:- start:12622 stop:13095 length:474 start_codon:yes stop_codon:yes gene_type:complete